MDVGRYAKAKRTAGSSQDRNRFYDKNLLLETKKDIFYKYKVLSIKRAPITYASDNSPPNT